MSFTWSLAFLIVGWALVFLGVIILLGSGPAVPVLLLGLLHLGVGVLLRRRERRRAA